MRRSTTRFAGMAAVLTVGLALAGCSSKAAGSTTSESGDATSSAELSIQPLIQVDAEGVEASGATGGTPADPAGDGTATCSDISLGMMGALTGPNAALGTNIVNGVQLAVDAHNAANPDCQVTLKQFDTEGDPQKATQVAPTIVADASVVGIVGPAFSGESKATGPIFSQANVLMLSPSATNPGLTTNGWTNFIRGLGNDNSQGGAIANYATGTLGGAKICVVQDDSDYGVGLAEVVTETLGDVADPGCASKVKAGDKDFTTTVQIIKDAAPDAVYYAGYYAEAAPFVSQLRSGGVDAVFISGDGVNDPEFVKQAGSATDGAYLTCPCAPAADAFATAYTDAFSVAPGTYSVEGYDLATIILKGIDSGITDRAALVDFVHAYDGQGYAKAYKWDETGELAVSTTWIYQVQ